MLKKHFWLLAILKTVMLPNLFVKLWCIILQWLESPKEEHLFEI